MIIHHNCMIYYVMTVTIDCCYCGCCYCGCCCCCCCGCCCCYHHTTTTVAAAIVVIAVVVITITATPNPLQISAYGYVSFYKQHNNCLAHIPEYWIIIPIRFTPNPDSCTLRSHYGCKPTSLESPTTLRASCVLTAVVILWMVLEIHCYRATRILQNG